MLHPGHWRDWENKIPRKMVIDKIQVRPLNINCIVNKLL